MAVLQTTRLPVEMAGCRQSNLTAVCLMGPLAPVDQINIRLALQASAAEDILLIGPLVPIASPAGPQDWGGEGGGGGRSGQEAWTPPLRLTGGPGILMARAAR
jgi:hypothetical protein